ITINNTSGNDINLITTGQVIIKDWEFISPNFRPTNNLTSNLGDSTHVISNIFTQSLNLYSATNQHNIITNANANYTWTTPTSNINQFIISDNTNNILWQNQCDIGYINTNQVSPIIANIDYLNKRSGVIVRVETPTDNSLCLWSVQPTLNAGLNKGNQFLVTD